MSPRRASMRGTIDLLRRWAVVSGRDAVATTRESLLSLEARAGAALFFVLAILGWASAGSWFLGGPEEEDALLALVRPWGGPTLILWRGVLLFLHLALGVVWGLAVKNAWSLIGRVWPRVESRRFRSGLVGGVTVVLAAVGHGLWLCRDAVRHPALYPGFFGSSGVWGDLSGESAAGAALVTLAARGYVGLLIALALAAVLWRLKDWFLGFSRPTRLAIGVLGSAAGVFGLGLWGVSRAQEERNAGPNVVFLSVEGLRSDVFGSEAPWPEMPRLREWARQGQVWTRCVPAISARGPALTTILTGLSPLSHGVRHDYPAAHDVAPPPPGDLGPMPETLPDLFRRRGARTAVVSAAGGEFFDRHKALFDIRRVPRGGAGPLLRRRILERSLHLLPYLSGPGGRRWFSVLRGSPALADPMVLAGETVGVLRRVRFQQRFFLWVHFANPEFAVASPTAAARLRSAKASGEGTVFSEENNARRRYAANGAALDEAFGEIENALRRWGLADTTTVALWSPFAAGLSESETREGHALTGGTLFLAPFVVRPPARSSGVRRETPVRAVDVPSTLASLAGLSPPEGWEGVALDPSSSWPVDERTVVYAESVSRATPGAPITGASEGMPPLVDLLIEDRDAPGFWRVDPAWDDLLLARRDRMILWGSERLIYRPGPDRVRFDFDRLGEPGTSPSPDLSRELKEVFYRYLAREAGWRPQNDYWIPEAFLREVPKREGRRAP